MGDFPFPSPVPGAPPLPGFDFSAGPSNAAGSLSTPVTVGGISTGGDSLLPLILAAAAAFFLLR